MRRPCRLPIGLHPVFRLPAEPGGAHLELGSFRVGHTYPHDVEPGMAVFAANRSFRDLAAVPGRAGSNIDATTLPLEMETEELLQIEGLDGRVALSNLAERYRAELTWDTAAFSQSAVVDVQSRTHGSALEWPPPCHRHRANLLALRAWPGDGAGRQSDRPVGRTDRAGLLARHAV